MQGVSEMRQAVVWYPFCPEFLPVVRWFEQGQESYELRYLVSPPGCGYGGRDAGEACNQPPVGRIVSEELPFDREDWDTLLLCRPGRIVGELRLTELAEEAAVHGKQVLFVNPDRIAEIEDLERLKQEYPGQVGCLKLGEIEPEGRFYRSQAPVILFGGFLAQSASFEAVLELYLKVREEGYRPAVFCRNEAGGLFGFYGFARIWNAPVRDENERIKSLNAYINGVVRNTYANLILIEAPDALMRYNANTLDCFGVRSYMLCQAVVPDYLVGCVSYELLEPELIEKLSDDCRVRLGCEFCAVWPENVVLDVYYTSHRKRSDVVYMPYEYMYREVRRRKEQGGRIPVMDVSVGGAKELYRCITGQG